MTKHSFYKEVRDAAKAKDKSLIAFAYRGRTYRFDAEAPVNHEVADKLALFMITAMKCKDASLIPDPPQVGEQKEPHVP